MYMFGVNNLNSLGFSGRKGGNVVSLFQPTKYLEFSGGNYRWDLSSVTSQTLAGKSEVTVEVEVFQIERAQSCAVRLPSGDFWFLGWEVNGEDFFFLDWGDRINLTRSALDGSSLADITDGQNPTPIQVLVNSANWDTNRYVSSTFTDPIWLKLTMVMEPDGTTKTVYLYDPELDEVVFEGYSENRDNTPDAPGFELTIGAAASKFGNSFFWRHKGGLSFFRVWDKALTKAEVLSNFQNGINRLDSDLLINIELEEGSGTPKDVINDVTADTISNSDRIEWRDY